MPPSSDPAEPERGGVEELDGGGADLVEEDEARDSYLVLHMDQTGRKHRKHGQPCWRSRRSWLFSGAAVIGLAMLAFAGMAARGLLVWDPTDGRSARAAVEEFELLHDEDLPDFNCTARLYRHKRTGAEVISVVAPNPNKAVGLVFRTPVSDNKGTPHILEHSVLGGSENFPAQHPGPFDRLEYGSTATYLNALTYPDRTLYPCSSANLQEFYNLARVYMDAAFRPLVRTEEMIFRQEGWRLELDDAANASSADLVGVVLNEMRGVYSDASAWLENLVQSSLFPDTGYAYESGGLPSDIPLLEYEELQQFYNRFYHPSNARIWFYGDDPEETRLHLIAENLNRFVKDDEARSASVIKAQPTFAAPRAAKGKFPAQEFEGAIAGIAWALTRGTDGFPEEDELPMWVLDDLLVGRRTAAVYSAMQNSSLGTFLEDVAGLDEDYIQPAMYVMMRNVGEQDVAKVHDLVMETLQRLATEGFSELDIEASLNRIVMAGKTAVSESGTLGVDLLQQLAGPWVWGWDVFARLRLGRRAERLRRRLADGEDVFRPLVQHYLLDNPHRINVTLLPSATLAEEQEDAEWDWIQGRLARMSFKERQEQVEQTKAMAAYQAAADPPEVSDAIPSLKVADLDPSISAVATEVAEVDGGTLLEHLQPTAGVSFVRLALHLDSLPAGDFSLVMLLARLLTLAGTPEESPEQLSQRIGRLTGGISFEAHALDHTGGAVLPVMVVTGVAEYQQAGDLTGLMGEMLISPRLERDGSQALVAGTLDSEVANIESDMLSNGLSPSLLRSEAMLSGSRWVAEQLSGVTHLEALRSARFNLTHGGWERLKGRLERLQSALVTASRQQPVISVTGDAVALEGSRGAVKDLLRRLAAARSGSEPSSGHREWPTLPLRSEALVLTSGNNHVVSSALLPPETYQYSGASQMAATLLEEFLYSELRAKRGAYGAYSRLRRSGLLSMYTYRDPGLQTTVGVFRDASRYLVGFARDPDVQDLQRAVIAGVNMIDGYMPISERGWAALVDHLTGRTDDVRQKEKDELLAASAADVEALGTAMEKASFTLVAATTADAVQVANSGEVMFDASIAISPSRLVESDP